MDRTTALNHLISAGKRIFKDRDILANVHGTSHMAADRTAIQEEVMALIEGLGVAPSAADLAQALKAMKRLASGNFSPLTANTVLTPENAGVVAVSAAAGNVVLTLPAASAANGVPLRFTFVRLDGSGNTVTIARASGADSVEGAASTALVVGGRLTLVGNGNNAWFAQASIVPPAAPYAPPVYLAGSAGYLQLSGNRPGDPSIYLQWGVAGGGDDVPGSGSSAPAASFPMAFPNACLQVVGTLVDSGAGAGVLVSSGFDRFGVTFVVSEYATAVQVLGVRYFAIGY